MSAPVTEAHKQLVATIVERAFRFAEGNHKITPELSQLIADSEARATAELLQQVANLKYANHYHRKTAETSRATETDRNNLRADLDAIKAILSEEKARAESAEREAFDWKKIARYEAARAERAELRIKQLEELK